MKTSQSTRNIVSGAAALLGLSLLAGCSSSFGGGSDPSQPNSVVVPPGTRVVCQDGTAPPCQ